MTTFGIYFVIVQFLGILATFYYAGQGQHLVDKWFPITFWMGVFGTLVSFVILQTLAPEADWWFWLGLPWAIAFSVGLGGLITEGLIDSYIDHLDDKIDALEEAGTDG